MNKVTYTLNCDTCGESFNSTESFPSPQLCPKCLKVNELAEWVAFRLWLQYREEVDFPSISLKEAKATWICEDKPYIITAKNLLSHPDLALIDRERDVYFRQCGNVDFDKGYKACLADNKERNCLSIIPLAKELEVKDEKDK